MVRNIDDRRMEATFYEDSYREDNNVNQLKLSMTLDLNCAIQQAKKPKINSLLANNPVLSSPDLHMLKLGSPELERLIISHQNGVVTTMPTPSAFNFPQSNVTEEQELYARGFVDALNELHHSDSSQGLHVGADRSASSTSGGVTYTNLDQSHAPKVSLSFPIGSGFSIGLDSNVVVKDEPQTVPNISSSPPMSPIDMESQEKIKLERKRQRNRLAASKCRRRKLERISRLEDKVKTLKSENTDLSAVLMRLKEHVCQLKEQVMEHINSGCQIPILQSH
ncbi:transcription factor AP-1 [Ctenocephalides felis]|uniref:transcription factor AP-1 n=1 Tax=Ctenocephalides felis TaxID=7515 RepID=UPI000E6E3232|nr:transcription factor AP-1 [Ctenocephalides felis]